MELRYIQKGDVLFPDLRLEEEVFSIGKYGLL